MNDGVVSLFSDTIGNSAGFFHSLLLYAGLILGGAVLIYIYEFSMKHLDKWYQIPELVRWVLCWPIILFFFLLSGLFGLALSNIAVSLFFSDVSWGAKAVEILTPALMTGFGVPISFFVMYKLIPKNQIVFMGFALVFGVLFTLVLIFAWLAAFFENTLTFVSFIRDALQMTVWLVSAFMGFTYYKKSIKNQTVVNSPFNYYH